MADDFYITFWDVDEKDPDAHGKHWKSVEIRCTPDNDALTTGTWTSSNDAFGFNTGSRGLYKWRYVNTPADMLYLTRADPNYTKFDDSLLRCFQVRSLISDGLGEGVAWYPPPPKKGTRFLIHWEIAVRPPPAQPPPEQSAEQEEENDKYYKKRVDDALTEIRMNVDYPEFQEKRLKEAKEAAARIKNEDKRKRAEDDIAEAVRNYMHKAVKKK